MKVLVNSFHFVWWILLSSNLTPQSLSNIIERNSYNLDIISAQNLPGKLIKWNRKKEKEELLNLGIKFFMKYFLDFILQAHSLNNHFLNSYLSLCQQGFISPVTVLKKSIILICFLSFAMLVVNLRGMMWCPQVSCKKQKCKKKI